MRNNQHQYLSYQEALAKLEHYCAYQDRCHSEVRHKLISLKVYGDELEQIISDLIQSNFLNEERYARSFVRGKFRMKGWGRNKIIMQLKQKKVSSYCINKGLLEIVEEEYKEKIESLMQKKLDQYSTLNSEYEKKRKVVAYLVGRGFEYNLVNQQYEVIFRDT